MAKAIREPPSTLGEWSFSVTVFRAAKASLLVIGEPGSTTPNHKGSLLHFKHAG